MIGFILSDINANEATENPAEDMNGAIQEEITPEQEQKLDLEPFLKSVPQSESAGNTACALDHFLLCLSHRVSSGQ